MGSGEKRSTEQPLLFLPQHTGELSSQPPAVGWGYLSACFPRSFPWGFPGAFLQADLNFSGGKMMVSTTLLGNFSLLTASAEILLKLLFLEHPCALTSASQCVIYWTAEIKKEKGKNKQMYICVQGLEMTLKWSDLCRLPSRTKWSTSDFFRLWFQFPQLPSFCRQANSQPAAGTACSTLPAWVGVRDKVLLPVPMTEG